MTARRVAETWVKQHKTVKVRVVRGEMTSLMYCVVIVHYGTDLHLIRDAVLDNGPEWIRCRALRDRELIVSIRHALRAYHDEMDLAFGEKVSQLHPC